MRYGNKTLQFGHTIQKLNHDSGTYNLWAEMVWTEMVMGRNGYGPLWLCAKMTRDPFEIYLIIYLPIRLNPRRGHQTGSGEPSAGG